MTNNRPDALPGYGLTMPTEASTRQALERVLGPKAVEIWAEARQRAGCAARPVNALSDLKRVVEAMAEMGGAASVCAKSASVRIVTYEMLVKKNEVAARKVGT